MKKPLNFMLTELKLVRQTIPTLVGRGLSIVEELVTNIAAALGAALGADFETEDGFEED